MGHYVFWGEWSWVSVVRSWAGLGFCHPFHNLLLMTLVGCFTMWPVVPKGFCSISAFSSPPLDYHSGVSVHHSWSTHSSGTWWQAHSDSVLGSPGSAFVFSKLCATRLFFFLQCPTFPFPWKRKWQPTPVFLPGKSHEQRSLVGYSPWGHKESVTTERLHFLSFFLSTFPFPCLPTSALPLW